MSANIIRLARFDLDYKNRLLKTSNDIATASKVVQPGEAKIQGATSIDGKFFLTEWTESHYLQMEERAEADSKFFSERTEGFEL